MFCFDSFDKWKNYWDIILFYFLELKLLMLDGRLKIDYLV